MIVLQSQIMCVEYAAPRYSLIERAHGLNQFASGSPDNLAQCEPKTAMNLASSHLEDIALVSH